MLSSPFLFSILDSSVRLHGENAVLEISSQGQGPRLAFRKQCNSEWRMGCCNRINFIPRVWLHMTAVCIL